MKRILTSTVLVLFLGFNLNAQDTKSDLKTAKKLFNKQFYRDALPYLERVSTADPSNYDVKYMKAVSYLNTYKKREALTLLEDIEKNAPNIDPHVQFWFGKVDQMFYEFDDAIDHYNKYKLTLRSSDSRMKDVDTYIEQCQKGKEFVKRPKDFVVQNAGEVINSPYSDHSPIISKDGKTFIFTSRRQDVTGTKEAPDGEYFEDIFISELVDGKWTEPHSIGKYLNTTGHEASIQLFDNDTKLMLYKYTKGGDFYITSKEEGQWTPPVRMSSVNSVDFESDAHISPDGNTMYYSSDHESRDGNLDIYVVESDGNGGWKEPRAVTEINSDKDDDSPFLAPDGKTLYFSSRGHNSIGGYDVYKTEWNASANKWGTPVNLGYPINTPDNDIYYYQEANSTMAYYSSFRLDSYGEKDIYKIIPIPSVVVEGLVFEEKSKTPISGVDIIFKRQVFEDSLFSAADSSKLDKNYSVKMLSSNKYKVYLVKKSDTLSVEDFEIALASTEGEIIKKDFYVTLPVDTTADTIQSFDLAKWKFNNIYYPFDKSELTEIAIKELDYIAKIMIAYPDPEFKIRVVGHTDSKGADQYNLVLSKKRAKEALDYLVSKGVVKSRLTLDYKGETEPAEANDKDGKDNPEGRLKNRRTEFKLANQK